MGNLPAVLGYSLESGMFLDPTQPCLAVTTELRCRVCGCRMECTILFTELPITNADLQTPWFECASCEDAHGREGPEAAQGRREVETSLPVPEPEARRQRAPDA